MTQSRTKLLLISALVCIAALGADTFVVEPLVTTWKARSERIAKLREDIDRGERLLDLRTRYTANWQEMQSQSLMEDPAVAEKVLLGAVDKWARNSNLTVTNYKPSWLDSEDETDPGARKLEVGLSGTGNLQTLTRFLYELERDSLAVNLQEYSLTARDDKGRELTLDARFTGLQLSREKAS